MQAKPHQIKHNAAVIEAYDAGWRQQLTSMATGTGKTFCFSTLYEDLLTRLPGRMLVLAHRDELIKQAVDSLQARNPGARIDIESGDHKADPANADIIVASIGTLGRKNTPRLAKYDNLNFDKFVIDEAHHSTASSYINILEHFGLLKPDTEKLLLGVTATTQRGDGVELASVFKKLAYVYSLRQAIEDGVLVDIKAYSVSGIDLSNIDLSNESLIAEAVDSPTRNQRIVKAWNEKAYGRKTIVYASSVQHALNLSCEFSAYGVDSTAVWGDDPDRESKLQWHKNSAAGVLVNCELLIEGYDDPAISCVVLGAPTASPVKFTQMCGRGTRLYPGKYDCIILDITDQTDSHSLCTIPTLMGLPKGMKFDGQSLLKAVEEIEAAQETYADIDFTKLESLDKLNHFIEQINLFTIRFPKEVEDNSDFRWKHSVTGGYVMSVPRPKLDTTGTPKGEMRIEQNILDKWVIKGYLKGREICGERDTLEEAFAACDQAIRERTPESVALVNRKAAWAMKPTTKAQWAMLKNLYKGKEFPVDMTAGQASEWIDQKLNKGRLKK